MSDELDCVEKEEEKGGIQRVGETQRVPVVVKFDGDVGPEDK